MKATLNAPLDFALPGDVPSARTTAAAAIIRPTAATASFLLVTVLLSFELGARGLADHSPLRG
jgi:hypothetical protein